MAKSEIPSIVVQSGGGSSHNSCDMEQQYPSSRPPRLEKQEEFDEEDPPPLVYMPSTVTIQIEDRGSGPDDNSDGSSGENYPSESKVTGEENVMASETLKSENLDVKSDRSKVPSQRVKLLVRSQAVHDDASPPPDLETIVTNTNMLSVTNAPAFATQTQSKSSNKNRLGRQGSSQGSQGSTESSSGLSRDSSTETYTDSTGIDLQQFIIETLHKNQKDRIMMLKIENELTALVKDSKRHTMKFAQMSSYNRMLVHRVAAFFGFDHYVDANGTSVIVNKTKNTRLPDARFHEYFRDELLPEEPKKSILKRDSISFEEGKEKSPERQSSTDSRRSKSFEEREEEYEKARARIFNQDEGFGESPISRRSSQEDIRWPSSDTRPWSSTDSDSSGRPLGAKGGSSFETEGTQVAVASSVIAKCERPVAVLSKAESESKEVHFPSRMVRPVMTKASSFGGISVLTREGSSGRTITPKITKAESFNVTTLSSSPSLCAALPSQVPCSSAPSPSLLVTSTIGMKTSCPSQFVATNTQQTFPIVAGQPTQLHIPIQQFSSQVSAWPVEGRDVPVSDFSSQGAVGQHCSIWPVSSTPENVIFPGGIVLNPQSGNSYANVDNVVYRYKVPSNASSGQTIMLAPYQTIAVQPPNQVPISSQVSPPTQAPSAHQAVPSNLQLPLNPQQQQQQPVAQLPQTPTVVYVPYITSQIPSAVVPQQSIGGGTVQAVAPQQQQQQQIPSQAQPLAQAQILGDQQAYAATPNPGSVEELATQISGLSLIPPHMPQAPNSTSGRNLVGVDSAQNYVVPTFKSQGYVSPQGNFPTFPVYYVQQVQQASNVHPVRYVFPTSSPITQQVAPGSGSNIGIGGQIVADVQSHVVTQANTQITGRSDQSKCLRPSQLHALSSSGCRPGGSLICPRGVPVMQDLCLIGHPLQHHFNPLMFPQQRPITRFIHSQNSGSTTNRPPKNRGRRNKGGVISGLSNGARNSSFLSAMDLNAGNVLEIEGLPEGMKRSEIERYLEPATCHGAKIQFMDSESGAHLTNETDFVVCSRHIVIAIFESDTAAQSALLGIKTPKFQLRPVRQSTKDISQKKYS